MTYALFAAGQIAVTRGVDLLGLVNKIGRPDLHFRPIWHLNYAEATLPVRDGLPKLKDFPVHAGGSGEMLAE